MNLILLELTFCILSMEKTWQKYGDGELNSVLNFNFFGGKGHCMCSVT